jgi:hypothetical protein
MNPWEQPGIIDNDGVENFDSKLPIGIRWGLP